MFDRESVKNYLWSHIEESLLAPLCSSWENPSAWRWTTDQFQTVAVSSIRITPLPFDTELTLRLACSAGEGVSLVTLFSLRFVLEETRHSVLTQNSIVGFDVEHEKSNGCSKRRLLKLSFQSCESEWAKLIAYQLLKTKIGESFLSEFGVLGTWGLIEGWRRSLRSLTRRQGKDDVLFQGDNAIKPMVKQLVYGHKGLKGSQIK